MLGFFFGDYTIQFERLFFMKTGKYKNDPKIIRADIVAAGKLAFTRGDYAKSITLLEAYLKQFSASQIVNATVAEVCLILGMSHFNVNNYALAYAACLRAAQTNPENPIYGINVARCLAKLGDLQGGLKELMIIPESKRTAEWWSTVGGLRSAMGDLSGSESAFQQALQLNPVDPEANSGLVSITFRQQKLTEIETLVGSLKMDALTLESRCQIQIFRLINFWMQGDLQAVDLLLQASSSDLKKLAKTASLTSRIVLPFAIFIAHLLRFRQSVIPALFLDRTSENKILYAVGDSHCLSLANTYFDSSGGRYRVQAALNPGCKAFHLGSEKFNVYKAGLEGIVDQLPPNANLILMVGEIDCRRDEGILIFAEKTGGNPERIAQEVVEKYLRYLVAILSGRAIHLSICGVPAPCAPMQDEQSGHRFELQKILISAFNQALRKECATYHFGFLDVHAITSNKDGSANGKFHLDRIHLAPHFLVAAATGTLSK